MDTSGADQPRISLDELISDQQFSMPTMLDEGTLPMPSNPLPEPSTPQPPQDPPAAQNTGKPSPAPSTPHQPAPAPAPLASQKIAVELPSSNMASSKKEEVIRSLSQARSAKGKRKLFTVAEDAQILDLMERNPEFKLAFLAKMVSNKLGRSKESVRDRIRKHVKLLSDEDKAKLRKAAKV